MQSIWNTTFSPLILRYVFLHKVDEIRPLYHLDGEIKVNVYLYKVDEIRYPYHLYDGIKFVVYLYKVHVYAGTTSLPLLWGYVSGETTPTHLDVIVCGVLLVDLLQALFHLINCQHLVPVRVVFVPHSFRIRPRVYSRHFEFRLFSWVFLVCFTVVSCCVHCIFVAIVDEVFTVSKLMMLIVNTFAIVFNRNALFRFVMKHLINIW